MSKDEIIELYEDQPIRTAWNETEEEWYFSIVDVVGILTEQQDQRGASNYWAKLKQRLKAEGADQLLTNCQQLKLKASDGRHRLTDVATTEQLLRIIQSIPSKKAEPFKMWLAQVGADRVDEIADPEKAILRGADYYRAKGYTEGWINQRLQSIEMRKELTDEWKARGIEKERDYKQLKGLKKENLRDNMTNVELVLNMLAEVTTTAISKSRKPETFIESKEIAREGGDVAKDARLNIEKRTGNKVISSANAKDKLQLEIKSED